jgi:diguanylate cyclase (GGDEF)-like protein
MNFAVKFSCQLYSLIFAMLIAALPCALIAKELPRHPLEIQALTEPEVVLKAIPNALSAARAKNDMRAVALIYLARANACRVMADWPCQRSAGGSAREAALLANDPVLEVRGLIADSRAAIAMQDFIRGEELLTEAEVRLQKVPMPELKSEVYLAYSSLSFTLTKPQKSAEYAQRGLDALPETTELATRARLLRNLGRALAQLGQSETAQAALTQAQDIAKTVNDPKLIAELHLETARIAHLAKDIAVERENGNAVVALGGRLKNSQINGMGLEVLGIASLDADEAIRAQTELRAARASFSSLKLERDELRVLRLLIPLAINAGNERADIAELTSRLLTLSKKIEDADRAKSAEDYDARLAFNTKELEVKKLKVEAEAAREREKLLLRNTRLAQLAAALVALTLAVLIGFFLQLRRNKTLQERLARADVLTGIANRRKFDERLKAALARSKRQKRPITLLTFDIDKFKRINDTYGHAVGDAVIVEFARRISATVREADMPARLGGDEFAVLVEDGSLAIGELIAKKILGRMQVPMQIGDLSLDVTTSIGVGYCAAPETIAEILALADQALYAAKEAGRNTVRALSLNGVN